MAMTYMPYGIANAGLPPMTALVDIQPNQGSFGQRRRQFAADPTSGTLTITVAPDETCGFDTSGDPVYTCLSETKCSWESGQLNRFFCGWDYLRTTCIPRSVATNENQCSSSCISNTYNAFCGFTDYPFCVSLEFGSDGIISYGCNSNTSPYPMDSTRSNEDREFLTVVMVDGNPTETLNPPNTSTRTKTSTSSSTESSEQSQITSTEPPTSTTASQDDPTTITTVEQPTSTGGGNQTNVGAIVGGVVGGLAVIGFFVVGIFGILILRRRSRNNADNTAQPANSGVAPPPPPQPQFPTEEPKTTYYTGAVPYQPGVQGSTPTSPMTVNPQDSTFNSPQAQHQPSFPQYQMNQAVNYQVPNAYSVHPQELDGHVHGPR